MRVATVRLTLKQASTVEAILDEWCGATALGTREVRAALRKLNAAILSARTRKASP